MQKKDGMGNITYYYTEEERETALETSLTGLAASLGYTPVRCGSHYKLKEMDSLIIYNDRSWTRWSGKGNRRGGTQIDFLLEFGSVSSVPEAVDYLAGMHQGRTAGMPVPEPGREAGQTQTAPERAEFVLPQKNADFRRLYAYLIKTRGLSGNTVDFFVKKGLIYEEAAHHNIVFLGKDKNGDVRYAGMRGTADLYGKKFRADVAGNDKNFGLNLPNPESTEVKVFESVIDCMSYMELTGDFHTNKLVLGMVADNPLRQFLADYPHIRKISFCLDNDEAGRRAVYGKEAETGRRTGEGLKAKYEAAGYEVSAELPPAGEGKDYNELLKNRKSRAAGNADRKPQPDRTEAFRTPVRARRGR